MAWIWFILLLIAVVYIFRLSAKIERQNRITNAALSSLLLVLARTKEKDEILAYNYYLQLDDLLPANDYDEFMTDVCQTFSVPLEYETPGGLISNSTRKKLAKRLAVLMSEDLESFNKRKRIFDDYGGV